MTVNRRDLIKGAVAIVPASIALGALNNRWAWAAEGDFSSDEDVLNYALTLEYLEAEFYRQGNAAVELSGKTKRYLATVQSDEESHVATITETIQAIGGTPVEAPGVDFGEAFASRESFLTTAHVFENVGVGAYLGAAGFIEDKMILQAAAGIFGVEARHAAILGNLLELDAEGGVYMGDFETPIEKADVLAAVAPFLVGAGAMEDGAAVTY